jgi:ATP-binding cassette subfamily B protein/subfamily B ATP-binding cassette protein MsbA
MTTAAPNPSKASANLTLARCLFRAARYLRPYRTLALVSGCLVVLSSLIGLLAPWPLQILVDNVLSNHPLPGVLARALGPIAESRGALLVFAVASGFAITLATNGLTVLDNYVNTKIHESIVLDFRSDLFQHAQRLSLAYHDQRRTGMMIFAINNQGGATAGLLMAVPPLAQSVLTLVGMFWVLLRIDRTLAVLSLTVVPLLYYSVGYYMTHIQTNLQRVRGMEGESLSMIHEAMQMLRVIVAFGREGYEFQRFRTQGERTVAQRVKVTVQQTAFSLFVNSTTAMGTALVLGVGGYWALQGRLTAGQLLVVMSYIAMVYRPLEQISTTMGAIQDQIASLRIAYDLLDEEPDIRDQPGARDLERVRGDITFEHVSFSYAGRKDTLKDISFRAEAGRVVALVGPTGAGKTTLVSLIPRFYEATGGRVLLDGADIRQITLNSLRQHISIVLQEPLLFAGTIGDNIRYGRLEATNDEIVEAAMAANAHDFVMALPKQYDTVLGERGVQLSGGERQRISVARAFLKNAPVLILDEPTSSIDSKTEGVILDALDRLMVGRTTFMVAHRLSTIRHADLIVVLNHGELVEQGTHDELIAQNGLYRQLHDVQSGAARRRLGLVIGTALGMEKQA